VQRKRIEAMAHYALGWVISRTKLYDSIILERAAQFDQFVILGAGFDCRAYRLDFPSNLAIYEVDRPETQAHKRDCIRFVPGISERLKRVTFVPVNFNTQKIEDQLPASGYSKDKKTLFLWEAVTQYISAEAVDNVLKFVRENSASGSILCFDYKYKEAVDGSKTYAGLGLKTFVGQENEPYVFGVPEGKINQFLSDRGLQVDRVAKPDELAKLVKHSDTEKYLIPGFQEIVIARVP
jgi:methyltransferase (TIGR00027 family)